MMKYLQQQYQKAVQAYLDAFSTKHDVTTELELDGALVWVSDHYLISLTDIIFDIDTAQPKGQIFNWYNDNKNPDGKWINYQSYCMGLRVDDLYKDIDIY